MIRKNLHLIISVLIVIPAALFYGLFPNETVPILFDFAVQSTDLKNVFRAILGLYLAFSAFWIMGILKPDFWNMATLSNFIFMIGLVSGRMLSMILDGIPSPAFSYGIIGELILAIFALYQYRKYKNSI
ncbi:DUF4345 domain-containing protein [Flavobacterium sp.]|uniref:DUF4345 domain-containing protein n=1 Tax=Flavobacterium sp. TaxID=239 RepID=UPI0025BE5F34|nr:DUF4345 domain-containing protein [Flavobacterium sp.]MBA4154119.1 DUF4345 domain-containing protein [Flavobacterium sp.]